MSTPQISELHDALEKVLDQRDRIQRKYNVVQAKVAQKNVELERYKTLQRPKHTRDASTQCTPQPQNTVQTQTEETEKEPVPTQHSGGKEAKKMGFSFAKVILALILVIVIIFLYRKWRKKNSHHLPPILIQNRDSISVLSGSASR